MSFRMANKIAKHSQFYQHRVGAVIVKSGRIISTGFNRVRYSKHYGRGTLHAEQAAILKVLKNGQQSQLVGAVLYVSRWTPGGRLALSRPCVHCMAAIQSVGIKLIHYTTDTGTETIKC